VFRARRGHDGRSVVLRRSYGPHSSSQRPSENYREKCPIVCTCSTRGEMPFECNTPRRDLEGETGKRVSEEHTRDISTGPSGGITQGPAHYIFLFTTLKMEAALSYETSLDCYRPRRSYKPEKRGLYLHRGEAIRASRGAVAGPWEQRSSPRRKPSIREKGQEAISPQLANGPSQRPQRPQRPQL
jgi:hypothetical protein